MRSLNSGTGSLEGAVGMSETLKEDCYDRATLSRMSRLYCSFGGTSQRAKTGTGKDKFFLVVQVQVERSRAMSQS